MSWTWVLFSLFCVSTLTAAWTAATDPEEDEFFVDMSNWVDPGNMVKFDASKVVMTEERGTQATGECSCPKNQLFDSPDVDCRKTKEKLTACRRDLSVLSKILQRTDGNPKTDAFFRRLSIILMNKLSEMDHHTHIGTGVAFEFNVNNKFVEKVSRLMSRGVNESTPVASIVDDVSDVIIPLIQKSVVRDRESIWVQYLEYLALAAAAAVVLIFLYLLLKKKIYAVVTTSFVISVLWEWRRMYEEEVVHKELRVMKGPADCGQQWYKFLTSGLLQAFSFAGQSSDPCHEYFSSVGVKTILKCNPLLAVQNVLGMIFGGSFALLASYAGQATEKYFAHIPFFWTPVAGAAVIVMFVFTMTFSFGYDVRSPFLSLTRNSTASVPHVTHLSPTAGRFLTPRPTDSCISEVTDAAACVVKPESGDRDRRDGGRSLHKSPSSRRTQSLDHIPGKGRVS